MRREVDAPLFSGYFWAVGYKLLFQGFRSWFAHLFFIISKSWTCCRTLRVSGPAGPLPMPESSSRVDTSLTLQDTWRWKIICFSPIIRLQILSCFTENMVSVTDGIFLPPCRLCWRVRSQEFRLLTPLQYLFSSAWPRELLKPNKSAPWPSRHLPDNALHLGPCPTFCTNRSIG